VLRLDEVARPAVGDDGVLIRVKATSVNTPDWIAVAGVPYVLRLRSGLRRPSTAVRGTDVAGVVEEVGSEVTDLRPGDEVFGSLWEHARMLHPRGTFAELTVAPASQVIEKPAGLSFEEAGATVMSGLNGLIAMRDVGRVGPGTQVLINGASGGVGTFAAQIAKALGAEVTGVCPEPRAGALPRRGPRHRLHGAGLHARRAALRRDEPPAVRDDSRPETVGDPHPEQHREHRRLLRRPPEDGAGEVDGPIDRR
jgi:NADPH:quinone reductase-like Zn-dependent oxidoreductase